MALVPCQKNLNIFPLTPKQFREVVAKSFETYGMSTRFVLQMVILKQAGIEVSAT